MAKVGDEVPFLVCPPSHPGVRPGLGELHTSPTNLPIVGGALTKRTRQRDFDFRDQRSLGQGWNDLVWKPPHPLQVPAPCHRFFVWWVQVSTFLALFFLVGASLHRSASFQVGASLHFPQSCSLFLVGAGLRRSASFLVGASLHLSAVWVVASGGCKPPPFCIRDTNVNTSPQDLSHTRLFSRP